MRKSASSARRFRLGTRTGVLEWAEFEQISEGSSPELPSASSGRPFEKLERFLSK